MKTTVTKWGNSIGIRIPSVFAKQAGVSDGDKINMMIRNKTIVIEKTEALKDLLKKVDNSNIHAETDWGHKKGKELW